MSASAREGSPFSISLFGGPLFDWRTLNLDNPIETPDHAVRPSKHVDSVPGNSDLW